MWRGRFDGTEPGDDPATKQLKLLLLQRRIPLLNYLYETVHSEHRAPTPEYQAENLRRVEATLGE